MRSDLWAITCYFNSCGYQTKRANYEAFMEDMRATGVDVLVIEMAFGDDDFELPASDNVIQVRGNGLMWQKERLLNIAAKSLPSSCRKIAWLDCDILFKNRDWVKQTSEALDKLVVVEPFGRAVRLPRGVRELEGGGTEFHSLGKVYAHNRKLAASSDFERHGHTGFAWAARRELFEHCGLYDACLTGTGDHLMAHAFTDSTFGACTGRMIGIQGAYPRHFSHWAAQAQEIVKGRVGYVPGALLHLWHGDDSNRRYSEHNRFFQKFDFDPEEHLAHDQNGLWKWRKAPPQMRQWAEQMFYMRKEDGEAQAREEREERGVQGATADRPSAALGTGSVNAVS